MTGRDTNGSIKAVKQLSVRFARQSAADSKGSSLPGTSS